ncbi:hypothetical protein IWQ61_000451 [Dispira simplex]|nr:hypothetical protein IWQ61_000451 [Dispira simplex]
MFNRRRTSSTTSFTHGSPSPSSLLTTKHPRDTLLDSKHPALSALQAPPSSCHRFDRRKDYDFDLTFDQANLKAPPLVPVPSDPLIAAQSSQKTHSSTKPDPPGNHSAVPHKATVDPALPSTVGALPPLVQDLPTVTKTTSAPHSPMNPEGMQRKQTQDGVTEKRKLVDAEREVQRQASQSILNERQKIAYVGMCSLLFIELETLFDVQHKEAIMAISSYLNFVRRSMRKLYRHMELNASEQKMIEQLSRDHVKIDDLMRSLISEGETITVTSEQQLSVASGGTPVKFTAVEEQDSSTAMAFGSQDIWKTENPFDFTEPEALSGANQSNSPSTTNPAGTLLASADGRNPSTSLTSPSMAEWDLASSIDPFKGNLGDDIFSDSMLFSNRTREDPSASPFADLSTSAFPDGSALVAPGDITHPAASSDSSVPTVDELSTTSPPRLSLNAVVSPGSTGLHAGTVPSPSRSPSPASLTPSAVIANSITIDIKKTIILDMFLLFLTDNVYDSRARYFLRRLAEHVHLDWEEVLRLEQSITEQLQYFEMADTSDTGNEAVPPLSSGTKSSKPGETHTSPVSSPPNSPVTTSPSHSRNPTEGLTAVENIRIHAERINRYNKKEKKRRWVIMGLATIGGGLVIGLSTGLLAPAIGAGLGAAFATVGVSGTTAFFGSIGGAALITTGGALAGSSLAGIKMERRTRGISTFEFLTVRDRKRVSLFLTIPGWLMGNEDDGTRPFSVIDEIVGDQYALKFEPEMLRELGSILKMLAGEVLSTATIQILQYTMLHSLMSALTWPLTLSKIGYLVDNPWSIGLDRTRKAGAILADVLLHRAQGERPVSLVGYSLGARVIFYCLLELSKANAFGIVEDVYMFGAPVTAPTEDWRRCSTAVGGRLVNAYARNDWVLGFLYRYTNLARGVVAGLMPVEGVARVENVDISDIMDGHMAYRAYMPKLLRVVGIPVTSDEFLDAEEEVQSSESAPETPGAATDENTTRDGGVLSPMPMGNGTSLTPESGIPSATAVRQARTPSMSRSFLGNLMPFSAAKTIPPSSHPRNSSADDLESIRLELEQAGCVVKEIESTMPKLVIDPTTPSPPPNMSPWDER